MKCQKCGADIKGNQAMQIHGQTVCEDCYIDLAVKPKTCDPWAVYSARSLSSANMTLNENQARILDYLEKNGPTTPEKLAAKTDLRLDEFEREMATLRHMEKARAQLQDGRKVICPWRQG